MNLAEVDLEENSTKLYNFLHKWAFKVDRAVFEESLEKMRENIRNTNKGEQRKQGWFFMALLQKMDRYIDWKIAQEMEIDFEKRKKN